MTSIGGREPAFWIGLATSIVVAVLGVLTGQGVISEALAGNITNGVNAFAQILVILAPVIAGLVIRSQVTPTSAPVLNKGTAVTVVTPPGNPNTATIL